MHREGGKNGQVVFCYVIGEDAPVDLQGEQTGEQAGGPEWILLLMADAVIAVVFVLAILMLRQ